MAQLSGRRGPAVFDIGDHSRTAIESDADTARIGIAQPRARCTARDELALDQAS